MEHCHTLLSILGIDNNWKRVIYPTGAETSPGYLYYFRSTYEQCRISNRNRKVKSVITKYIPSSVKMNNFYIYRYFKIYNSLDTYIKNKSIKGFKQEINHMMRAGTIPDTMDWLAASTSTMSKTAVTANDITLLHCPSSFMRQCAYTSS